MKTVFLGLTKTYEVSFLLLAGGTSHKLLQKSLHSPGELLARNLLNVVMHFERNVCDLQSCCDKDFVKW